MFIKQEVDSLIGLAHDYKLFQEALDSLCNKDQSRSRETLNVLISLRDCLVETEERMLNELKLHNDIQNLVRCRRNEVLRNINAIDADC